MWEKAKGEPQRGTHRVAELLQTPNLLPAIAQSCGQDSQQPSCPELLGRASKGWNRAAVPDVALHCSRRVFSVTGAAAVLSIPQDTDRP